MTPKHTEVDYRTLLEADKNKYGPKWFYHCLKMFLYSNDQVYPSANIVILYKHDFDELIKHYK